MRKKKLDKKALWERLHRSLAAGDLNVMQMNWIFREYFRSPLEFEELQKQALSKAVTRPSNNPKQARPLSNKLARWVQRGKITPLEAERIGSLRAKEPWMKLRAAYGIIKQARALSDKLARWVQGGKITPLEAERIRSLLEKYPWMKLAAAYRIIRGKSTLETENVNHRERLQRRRWSKRLGPKKSSDGVSSVYGNKAYLNPMYRGHGSGGPKKQQ